MYKLSPDRCNELDRNYFSHSTQYCSYIEVWVDALLDDLHV